MSLKAFFDPRSVAVVGASRQPGKVGHEILVSLVRGGFPGKIFPVNPRTEEVEGLPCHPDLNSIGEVPDLVVVVVPSKAVAGVLRECGRLGVKQVVVITSGFKEAGEEGRKLEQQIVQIARDAGIRMLGPNCLGLMVPSRKLNASFGGPLPEPGNIGYFSQSGSLLAAIVDLARASGLGFSKLISIGNKADIGELEILRTLAQDDETHVIAGYLETIADGDAFIREAERISREKPILLMKAGETGAGAVAASSHTGRLADTQRAYEVVFERAGVIRCRSIKAQFDCARAVASQPLPAVAPGSDSRRGGIVIIANTGGLGIMATDAAEREGLSLAAFEERTVARLRDRLPAAASVNNPIDVLGDALADRFEAALDTALGDAGVSSALVLLTPHAMTECAATAEAVVRAAGAHAGKPVLACFLGAERVQDALGVLRAGGIPCYDSPESAVATVAAMTSYARWRSRPKRVVRLFPVNRRKVEKILQRHLRLGHREIGEMEAKDMLEAYGFVTPKGLVATSAEQATNFADQIGYPVVLKIWSQDIVHKAEVGGVRSGLTSGQEVMDAFDLMMYRIPKKCPDAQILGVLVEEMCKKGREVILGMNRDPRYGPLMMFGMGGVLVEVLRDVAFYLAPLTAEEAKEMLVSTRTYQLLRGDSAHEGVDIDAIAEGLQRLSQLVTEFPQIQEMDINPYVVGPEGTTPIAVDARIAVAEP
jgi:acetyl coenzyme A synthetase (ADP forming)-like protein